MNKMIDEKNVTYDEALDKYPDCKILMINAVDDCRGTISGDLVAVSNDSKDFKSLCDIKKGYIKEQKDPLLIGDYADGGAIGVQYEIKRDKRLTWEELVRSYPDKWVILRDVEEEGSTIISAILVEVCTDEDVDEHFFSYIKKGKKVEKRRTTDFSGVELFVL